MSWAKIGASLIRAFGFVGIFCGAVAALAAAILCFSFGASFSPFVTLAGLAGYALGAILDTLCGITSRAVRATALETRNAAAQAIATGQGITHVMVLMLIQADHDMLLAAYNGQNPVLGTADASIETEQWCVKYVLSAIPRALPSGLSNLPEAWRRFVEEIARVRRSLFGEVGLADRLPGLANRRARVVTKAIQEDLSGIVKTVEDQVFGHAGDLRKVLENSASADNVDAAALRQRLNL